MTQDIEALRVDAPHVEEALRRFEQRTSEAIVSLTRPPERWGWEFVQPEDRRLSPERDHPPMRSTLPSKLLIVLSLCILWVAASIAIYALIPTATSWKNQHPSNTSQLNPFASAILIALIVTAIGNIVAIQRIFGDRAVSNPAKGRAWYARGAIPVVLGIGLALLGAFAAGPMALVLIITELRRYNAGKVYKAAVRAWTRRITDFEQAEQERFTTAKRFFPLNLSSQTDTTLVFGGTPDAWEALILTLGSSLLGSGQGLLILNLTNSQPGRLLAGLTVLGGLDTEIAMFADRSGTLWDFENVPWMALVDLVTSTRHTSINDARQREENQQRDRQLLRQVVEPLGPSSVSLARLRAALLVVMEDAREGPGTLLTTEEFDALSGLFGERRLERGLVVERASGIEETLVDLVDLEKRANDSSHHDIRLDNVRGAAIRVLDVDRNLSALERALQGDALFGLAQWRMRRRQIRADAIIVAGADRLSADSIEEFRSIAKDCNARPIFMFEHLRDDAPRLLGMGSPATIFLRLPNHREASEAADFIGTAERWKETERTTNSSWSKTTTVTSMNTPMGLQSGTQDADQHGGGRANADSLVREHIVNPEELQGLPDTLLLVVEPEPGPPTVIDARQDLPNLPKRRAVRAGEFNPFMVFSPYTMVG